jgi:hypothetical protein
MERYTMTRIFEFDRSFNFENITHCLLVLLPREVIDNEFRILQALGIRMKRKGMKLAKPPFAYQPRLYIQIITPALYMLLKIRP